MNTIKEVAVLGGGCFWCTEAVFKSLKGVLSVISGYAGGSSDNPSSMSIHSDKKDHAEVIKIEFDPSVITYKKLLEIFFDFHDPTTLNKQNYDTGPEYRSIILYTSDLQKQIAEDIIQKLQEHTARKIVTEVVPLNTFFDAESYHQNFYQKNPYLPYCDIMISPKIKKLKEKYADILNQ